MTPEKISDLRRALKSAEQRGGLRTLAAVSGVPYRRIVQILDGTSPPTLMEFTTLDTLR